MEIIKTGLEMSEAECPECGTTLRYWPSEVKTEVIDRYDFPAGKPTILIVG